MYKDFFAFSAKPFSLTPDPEFLYLSQNHKEALAHLTYGVESKSGFVMVTGDVGAGKTTLLRTLVRNLDDRIVLSQVTNTRVSYKELLELILEDFGLEPRGLNKTALLSTLNEFLIEKYRAGLNCVVVVDEAQNLGLQTLEGLRMLSNLETEKDKLLHIILAGQPGLRTLIDSARLEQLRQRITVRYHLGPLSAGEVGEYIRHRLGKVITDPEKAPVIPDEVIPAIHQATGGIPRLVNVFCDTALLHAYVAENRLFDPALVAEVADQVTRDQRGDPEQPAGEGTGPADGERRIGELEQRLDAMAAAVRASASGVGPPIAGDGAPDAHLYRQLEVELARKESALREREQQIAQREEEFNQKLVRVRAEWKKRIKSLESARGGGAGPGQRRFPPLRVYAYESDARLRDSLCDLLDGAGIPYEVYGDFQEMREALELSVASGWFAVAVVGAGADDAQNESHIVTLATGLPHLPTVYLSDIDLSTIRRRMFAAGANYFIEKPNGRMVSIASHRESLENLKTDLLRSIQAIHRQQKAVFEWAEELTPSTTEPA
jgi:putative secretion ATPase (PEP-CTERM system associated)